MAVPKYKSVNEIGHLAGDLFRFGSEISEIPKNNVRKFARLVEDEAIKAQPRNFKQFDNRQFRLKGPNEDRYESYASLVGLGLVTIAEYGSYHKPMGWTIYPKAYTKAAGKNSVGVTHVGRARIDKVRHQLERKARGEKVRLSKREEERVKHMVLAFNGRNGKAFTRFAHHKPIRAGHFMGKAVARAQERAGAVVLKNYKEAAARFM